MVGFFKPFNVKSFFRFVSPSALNDPKEPDQGFIISGCSLTAISVREPFPSVPHGFIREHKRKSRTAKTFFLLLFHGLSRQSK